ncbi:hypothetical protein KAU93_04535 [Candidatus Bathyarchaeota archaeon]|nr:hypothetical protein [Candidatus Bathyarchaeota archaeon]
MRKLILLALALMLVIIPSVSARATGTIRIDPVWPVMLESPADFTIWVNGAGNPTGEPNILLVMTKACWDSLTEEVVISWSGGSVSFTKKEFTPAQLNSDKLPPTNTTKGACYTVASLKDHLSYGLSEPISSTETIYWAMKPFLSNPLTGTPQTFNGTLPSSHPRMLVYALGKTEGSNIFDNKVPPTRAGFVVPELGPMLLILAPFSAFAIYAVRRRKVHLK